MMRYVAALGRGRQKGRVRPARTPSACALGQQVGAAMVEMAIVMLLFLLLLMGVVDFGRGVAAFNTISNAAREGAREGTYYDTSYEWEVKKAVRDYATLLPDLTDDDIDVSPAPNGPGGTWTLTTPVTVTVTYYFEAATPLIEQFLPACTSPFSAKCLSGERRLKLQASAQTVVQ